MVDIVIDIETVALPFKDGELENWKPARKLVDPAKIEKAKEEYIEKRWAQQGNSRIIAIGATIAGKKEPQNLWVEASDDTASLLNNFAEYVNRHTKVRFVGFNIEFFDWPHLLYNMVKHRVRFRNPPGKWDILDIRGARAPLKKGSLDFWLKDLNIPVEKLGEGSMVANWVELGEWDLIREYCGNDVIATNELYYHLKGVGGF